MTPGANDVPIDERGVPLASSEVSDGGVAARRSSTDLSLGELLGGQSDEDPVPFWLEGGRTIPNVADYKPGPKAYFAKKVWRHTGLALVGNFATGADSRNRRFAVTVDLRLVPVDRLKPDTASSFHGSRLSDDFTLPLAIVLDECDPKNGKPCAHAYKLANDGPHQLERTYPYRASSASRARSSMWRGRAFTRRRTATGFAVGTPASRSRPRTGRRRRRADGSGSKCRSVTRPSCLGGAEARLHDAGLHRPGWDEGSEDDQVDPDGLLSHPEQASDRNDGRQRTIGPRQGARIGRQGRRRGEGEPARERPRAHAQVRTRRPTAPLRLAASLERRAKYPDDKRNLGAPKDRSSFATCRMSSTSARVMRSTPPIGTTCSARPGAMAASTYRPSTRTAVHVDRPSRARGMARRVHDERHAQRHARRRARVTAEAALPAQPRSPS